MGKFFNTTGPCNPDDHYMLSPSSRLVGAQLSRYINQKLFWVLHAPRQTGKTTFLQSWMREINGSDKAIACYVSVERCQEFPKAEDSIPAICDAIQAYASVFLDDSLVPEKPNGETASQLDLTLRAWAKLVAPKPLIVLFDEVDVLQDQAMVSFLRQLRGGFAARGIGKFPVSVALVGMRDLKDYLVKSKDGKSLNPGSPFNIKEDSASLENFSRDDVHALLNQHTTETGQKFETKALDLVYDLSGGQPWLVNSLAKKCVWHIVKEETKGIVTVEHIRTAKEMLISDRAVHLDSLAERLRDPRVKKIVQTILTGDSKPEVMRGDDFRYTLDMGLVDLKNGTPSISNPIYREVIARVLSEEYQLSIPEPEFTWKNADGTLDMTALMKEFQKFWSWHSDVWEEKADYTEAFPHLLVMAFLQRVINGGGRVEREYAAGRGRVDLAVEYGGVWNVIEIKLVHPRMGRQITLEQGLEQVNRYRDIIDSTCSAWLVLFDRTPAGRQKSWEERLSWDEIKTDKGAVTVVGG